MSACTITNVNKNNAVVASPSVKIVIGVQCCFDGTNDRSTCLKLAASSAGNTKLRFDSELITATITVSTVAITYVLSGIAVTFSCRRGMASGDDLLRGANADAI